MRTRPAPQPAAPSRAGVSQAQPQCEVARGCLIARVTARIAAPGIGHEGLEPFGTQRRLRQRRFQARAQLPGLGKAREACALGRRARQEARRALVARELAIRHEIVEAPSHALGGRQCRIGRRTTHRDHVPRIGGAERGAQFGIHDPVARRNGIEAGELRIPEGVTMRDEDRRGRERQRRHHPTPPRWPRAREALSQVESPNRNFRGGRVSTSASRGGALSPRSNRPSCASPAAEKSSGEIPRRGRTPRARGPEARGTRIAARASSAARRGRSSSRGLAINFVPNPSVSVNPPKPAHGGNEASVRRSRERGPSDATGER